MSPLHNDHAQSVSDGGTPELDMYSEPLVSTEAASYVLVGDHNQRHPRADEASTGHRYR